MCTTWNICLFVHPINEEKDDLTTEVAASVLDHPWIEDHLIIILLLILELFTGNLNDCILL